MLLFPVRGLPTSSFNNKNIAKKAAIHMSSLIPVFDNSEAESFLAVYHKHTVFTSEEGVKENCGVGYSVSY